MAITLPASMLTIIGSRFLRLGTSYDNTRFFIDIPRASSNSRTSRLSYRLVNAVVSGSYNLSPLLGGVVLGVRLVVEDSIAKLIFTTNPTNSKIEESILYLTYVDEEVGFLLTEDEDYLLQENDDRLILEYGLSIEDATLENTTNVKNPYSSADSETKFFIIQEDDF